MKIVPGFLAVVLALFAFSCGSPKPTCSASICNGCCDDRGTCQFGAANQACGTAGTTCAVCSISQTCSLGSCKPLGGGVGGGSGTGGGTGGAGGAGGGGAGACAQSCLGCCTSAGVCSPGDSAGACGASGVNCAACVGSQVCVGSSVTRQCVAQACSGCSDSAGTCQNGLVNAACGSNGLRCVDCTTSGGLCSGGVCTGGTCSGCRDLQGICQAGTTRAYCGSGGSACVGCSMDQNCSNRQCVSGGAGGGGGQGGGFGGGGQGGGTGGGGTQACKQLSTFTQTGGFGNNLSGVASLAVEDNGTSPGNVNVLELITVVANGGSVPGTQNLALHPTQLSCSYCVVYIEGCSKTGNGLSTSYSGCSRQYLGVAGQATVSSVTGNSDAGSFSGSLSNVHLVEWSQDAGVVANGQCIDLLSESIFVTWP
jgi:hypothetical protein